MKLAALSFFALLFSQLRSVVSDDDDDDYLGHVVVLNNGVQEAGKSCTTLEWASINEAIWEASQGDDDDRRLLQDGSNSNRLRRGLLSTIKSSLQRHRHLTCRNCGIFCSLAGLGGCPSRRWRRRLYDVAECQGREVDVNDALDALQATVSPSCAALLGSQRDVSCTETTNDCDISNVSLQNRTMVLVPELPTTSTTTFCTSRNVTFGASTNFFIGTVTFVVRNTVNNAVLFTKTAAKEPYFYLGNTPTGPVTTKFAAGSYSMTVTSDYMPTSPTTVAFQVNTC